ALIVALSGCVGGDEKPAEVEPTPEATPAETPAATPAETPAATPAATPAVEETKTADAGDLFEPATLKDLKPLEDPASGCDELNQRILRMYDQDKDGKIDADWMDAASIDLELNRILLSEYDQVRYAYEHNCPVESAE
ncbi:MAG: hypothetical protein GQ567_07380, partial [Methanosarcinales archaeon]|nr:hypothetical protein [Methanosarcinales archaeon]